MTRLAQAARSRAGLAEVATGHIEAMSSATSHLKGTASRAADSKPLEYLARGGFVCYGIIHLLFGWLALQIAFGHAGGEGDQNGALQTLAGNGVGRFLLVVITIGMVGPGSLAGVRGGDRAGRPARQDGDRRTRRLRARARSSTCGSPGPP